MSSLNKVSLLKVILLSACFVVSVTLINLIVPVAWVRFDQKVKVCWKPDP